MSDNDPKIVTGLLAGILAIGGWVWTRTIGRVDKAHENIVELKIQMAESTAAIEARQESLDKRVIDLQEGVKAIHARMDTYFKAGSS